MNVDNIVKKLIEEGAEQVAGQLVMPTGNGNEKAVVARRQNGSWVLDSEWSDKLGATGQEPAQEPTAGKRRGRKRKSETTDAPANIAEDLSNIDLG